MLAMRAGGFLKCFYGEQQNYTNPSMCKCTRFSQINGWELDKHENWLLGLNSKPILCTELSPFVPIFVVNIFVVNWWDMLEFARPKLTSSIDFHYDSDSKALKPIYFRNHLINSLVVEKYGAALREMRLAIQAWIAPSYSYITYLLHSVAFQLYLGTCARTILFWARALFVYLFNWRVHLVRLLTS